MLVTQTGTGLDKLRARCRCSNAQKLLGAPGFSGTHILPSKIKKILDLKISSQIDKTMKKLKKNPSTIMKTTGICNILMYTYLIVPKLIYLLKVL